MENVFSLEDIKTVASDFEEYTAELKTNQNTIVIDNGSFECRLGWSGEASPRLSYRNVLAKTRKEKGKESELLVGNDIGNIEAVRQALRSPFDKDVVTHFEAQETLLDYGFSHLGLDAEDQISHPILMTETLAQPNFSRGLMNQVLFELYNVPAVAYGVDGMFSFQQNRKGVHDALVVSFGYQSIHFVPILDGNVVWDQVRRLNLGGAHQIYCLQRVLQLKYPAHVNSLTLSRAEKLMNLHTEVSPEFGEDLKLWRETNYYSENVRKIQLPFTVAPKPPPVDPEVIKARRQELARRLVELNARKRDERLVEDDMQIKIMMSAKDFYEQGYEIKYNKALGKLKVPINSFGELEALIEKTRGRIERGKESKAKEGMTKVVKIEEPETKRRREDMGDEERGEFDAWLEDVRGKLEELTERKAARHQRRQQLAKRRTAASQERMRIISQLAKQSKKDDNFGMRDDDWDVYKKISKEVGDSDSEEEGLKAAEFEEVLREHDPNYDRKDDEVERDSPEWHQVHMATERIRIPEILFQPSIIGHDQAGVSETIQYILSRFPPDIQDRLANNVFLTGGMAKFPGLKERLEVDLREMRPFQSTYRVTVADDPSHDAWKGASKFAEEEGSGKYFLSKERYRECGEGYLVEHDSSNRYFPSPPPIEKDESGPPTPLITVKEESDTAEFKEENFMENVCVKAEEMSNGCLQEEMDVKEESDQEFLDDIKKEENILDVASNMVEDLEEEGSR